MKTLGLILLHTAFFTLSMLILPFAILTYIAIHFWKKLK